jgi:hypothetical protein
MLDERWQLLLAEARLLMMIARAGLSSTTPRGVITAKR